MRIPKKVKEFFETARYMAFATVDKDGNPNVVAIGSQKIVDDETIWVFDAFFKKTKENILQNNKVSIAMWKKINGRNKGYQMKGVAKYHSEGKLFEEALDWIYKVKSKKIPRKGLVEIKVTEIYSITPTYEEAGRKINFE